MPETKARLAALGAEPYSSTPTEFGATIKRDTETLGRVVREAGIKPQ
jgi:tripartite-type tricarboxylate transporter receptor subunit TctC